MINILIYNHRTNSMERHFRELYEPMPYSTGTTLTVAEFRSNSGSDIIWTSRRVMESWNATRTAWGRPIHVGYAFKRIGSGGHADQSQHYAGTAFDVGQNLSNEARSQLRGLAASLNVWTYVEPAYLTPSWVHFDGRKGAPACFAGYPVLVEGVIGVYVCTLQDALLTVGIPGVTIDGIFGPATRRAVTRFQTEHGLGADGIVGCNTWTVLTDLANGLFS